MRETDMMMSMTHGTARHTPQIYIYIYITYTHIMSGAHIIYRSARPLLLLLAHTHTLLLTMYNWHFGSANPICFARDINIGLLLLFVCLFVCFVCCYIYITFVPFVPFRSVPFRSREGEWYAEWRSNIIWLVQKKTTWCMLYIVEWIICRRYISHATSCGRACRVGKGRKYIL